MKNNYEAVYLHLIWKTWDKFPLLKSEVKSTVYSSLLAKCKELKCDALALGGVEDHIHLLVKMHSTVSYSQLVKELKGSSSHLVHHSTEDKFFKWQGSYGALSVSKSALKDVIAYIENQETHHQRNYLWEELESVECED